jgi:hypothetical protein
MFFWNGSEVMNYTYSVSHPKMEFIITSTVTKPDKPLNV